LGPSVANGVEVTDSLNPLLNNITILAGYPTLGTFNTANGIWDVTGPLNKDDTHTLKYTAEIDDIAAETLLVNTATLTDVDEGDDNPANNVSSAEVTVNANANLSISKSDSPDPVKSGDTLTYTVTVDNAGPSDAANVVVTESLPAGVTFVSTTGCDNDPNGVPTCNLGTIVSGGSAIYTIEVTVDASTTGTITNTVSVTSDTHDSDTADNTTTEDTLVIPATGTLKIKKTVIGAMGGTFAFTVAPGDPTPIELFIADGDNRAMTGIATVPAVEHIITESVIHPGFGLKNVVCTDELGDELMTAPEYIEGNDFVTVTVPEDVNVVCDFINEPVTNMMISHQSWEPPHGPGDTVKYMHQVTNMGMQDAENVITNFQLPSDINFATSPDCTNNAGMVTCSLATVAGGESKTVVVETWVDYDAIEGEMLETMAEVETITEESDYADNMDEDEFMIAGNPGCDDCETQPTFSCEQAITMGANWIKNQPVHFGSAETFDQVIYMHEGNAVNKEGSSLNYFVVGSEGADNIRLGSGHDFVCSGSGDDVIMTGSGQDIVFSSTGVDQVSGGADADFIVGGEGGDDLYGDNHNSTLDGNDCIFGEEGNDSIVGNGGNDKIDGAGGDDSIDAGEGNNTILEDVNDTDVSPVDDVITGGNTTCNAVPGFLSDGEDIEWIYFEQNPPEITLYDDNPLMWPAIPFVDPGAYCYDHEDGMEVVCVLPDPSQVDHTVDGPYTIFYMAVDAAGNTAMESRLVIVDSSIPPPPPVTDIALVCDNSNCNHSNKDIPLREHLVDLGHTVVPFADDNTSWDTADYALIVISESVSSGKTQWLRNVSTPILTVEGANHDELFGDDGGKSDDGDEENIKIVSNHTIITNAGFHQGQNITVATDEDHLGYMKNNMAGVDELAHYDDESDKFMILAADAGVIHGDAGKRVFFGAQYFNILNANGVVLFNSALDWVLAP
jgi:uncharacterized repeat protein (TIGR01451 family)